jgi:metal-responsive CopG/Arc/MetJ family transcriptional regulator
MKTAISLPDVLFRRAERTAKRLGISRSELYARALGEFLANIDGEAIKASYDRAFSGASREVDGAFTEATARRALLDVEW